MFGKRYRQALVEGGHQDKAPGGFKFSGASSSFGVCF